MRLTVIIPAYNEKATIAGVLKRLEAVAWEKIEPEIIIVDDGSTDGTSRIIDTHASAHIIIHHAKNRGKSAAIRSGLALATGDFTIIQDGDLECDSQDIVKIFKHAITTDADAVYGSRRLNDSKVKRTKGVWYYHLGGIYLTTLVNLLYGISITDEPVAYKLVRTNILKSLDLKEEGFGFCPEVTAKLARRNIQIHEVAISYFPRTKGEGKKVGVKDALAATWILLKYRFIS